MAGANGSGARHIAPALCSRCGVNPAPFAVGNLPFHNAAFFNRCADCNARPVLSVVEMRRVELGKAA